MYTFTKFTLQTATAITTCSCDVTVTDTTVFGGVYRNAAPGGAKFAMCDQLVMQCSETGSHTTRQCCCLTVRR